MASDYASIRADNERRYGTDIARIGPMLLSDRYANRTHFIFEFLQNAEDALLRREDWKGSREVSFALSATQLRVAHYGKPFDEADVRGICGIGESTKDLTAIGRFGIGFKSVYAFTDRPEVHSGDEEFATESYVWPIAIPAIDRRPDETVFVLPLREGDEAAHAEIVEGLRQLGSRTLLFLRRIDEIAWSVAGGPSGHYRRIKPEALAEHVRRVVLLGEEHGKPDGEETWLLFSQAAKTPDDENVGWVEIAFSLAQEKTTKRWSIEVASNSLLVVFFPTVLQTNLGFLMQGPYRTTPSRDNVPRSDPWNQHLVGVTATLLVIALRWLRDQGMLDTKVLSCLPLDRNRFAEGTMFSPLFESTRTALASEALLPTFGGGYSPARQARLGRTQELRTLLSPSQLGGLFGHDGDLVWLSGDITESRTPELHQYLIHELNVQEVTPETIISRLDKPFLQAQSDEWIVSLYGFLNDQSYLRRRLDDVPLIRLEDGTHVTARLNGQPQAFLPGPSETDFPTVRQAVCATDEAREFLRSLGLTEPNPVDDIVRNVLPKYRADEVNVTDADYEADIRRITTAFDTDSKEQREKLLDALRETTFVMAGDAGDGRRIISWPGDVYLATERLKALFAGVPEVLLVDDTFACLRGEAVRDMLEACGAARYLRPIEDSSLSQDARKNLRVQAGHPQASVHNDQVTDWKLSGLKGLLDRLPRLESRERTERARLLWEELTHLEERFFSGEYMWKVRRSYHSSFDAAFVQLLKSVAWVPDANGELQCSGSVLFDTLGWKTNSFLLSKIPFKPSIIDQLAREAGIEPGVLDLLKKLGVTSEAAFRDRFGLRDEPAATGDGSMGEAEIALNTLRGDVPTAMPPVPGPAVAEPSWSERRQGSRSVGHDTGSGSSNDARERAEGQDSGSAAGTEIGPTRRAPGSVGSRPFISYVAVQPHDEARDPDGLDQATRMAIEAKAIDLILANEPKWHRTPINNPGFDLFEHDDDAIPTRWCEVKAMTGTLLDRPVGLSRTQWDTAREHGDRYWLYVVERAGESDARIVQIQDPAGKARTFTLDRGWLAVADVDGTE